MHRPSGRCRRGSALRFIAGGWLWLFATLWATLPVLDARVSHAGGGAGEALAERGAPDRTTPVVVVSDVCELCDLLHTAGGWPVSSAAPPREVRNAHGSFDQPSTPSYVLAALHAPARAPPAA